MKLLNEILGTKYPIIQGGMANIATGEFAAACSNAGALGLIGSGGMDADALRENIRHCRALTDQPFGVNIMLMHPQADEFAKIVVEEGVKIVTTGAGNPGKYMAMWKAAGITVIPVVAAAILAKHLEPLGIDAVIAEGTESGGHVGEMTTMALVPQVVDAVHVPVIAAGGIADGRGLAAALALGACGVQVGTCLLASTECPIHENYKAALLKARDSDTIVTGRIGGTPVRVLKNRMSREYVRQEKAGADKMELEKYTLTQQLAKNTLFTQEKHLARKAAEMFAALAIEKQYNKEQIFEMYVNTIYFGSGHYGIGEAAQGYFGKTPLQLTDAEAVMLAGLPNAPSAYSPNSSPDLAIKRMQVVLNRMVGCKKLTREQADALAAEAVTLQFLPAS